jgi:hypothetical protein
MASPIAANLGTVRFIDPSLLDIRKEYLRARAERLMVTGIGGSPISICSAIALFYALYAHVQCTIFTSKISLLISAFDKSGMLWQLATRIPK